MSPDPVTRITPGTPLGEVPGLTTPQLRALGRLDLATVGDLLAHYPRRYEDRTRFDRFPEHPTGDPVCVSGTVVKTTLRRFGRRSIFEATIQEGEANALSPLLVCRWFNLHYIGKAIHTGQRLVLHGRPKLQGKRLCIDHPEFEPVGNDDETLIHLNRITPVHPAGEGAGTRAIRAAVFRVLEHLDDDSVPEILPGGCNPLRRAEALRAIHFPENVPAMEAARDHLVLLEFFLMQLHLAARRREIGLSPGQSMRSPGKLAQALAANLPFPLTGAQQKVRTEIRRDMDSPHPMHRLLQGDVGSGKTLVALCAMLDAVEAGHQAILMAPTQILAEQHYALFRRLLAPLRLRVALRTGTRRESSPEMPLFDAAEPSGVSCPAGEPHLLVGTHALLHGESGLSRPGLFVIDEQHKFGVGQRAALVSKGVRPDVLVMSATPIPRTLAMTAYGDLDVSVLDEMPPGRGKIITLLRDHTKLAEAVAFLRSKLEEGRQAYVVYPVIDESENLQVKTAAREFGLWDGHLSGHRCELLHGRIPAGEKDAIMSRFRSGETQVLVATTVIEVGIDVPNATVLLVENAERFGLAQLHQLRGRIGRGEHKSWCILLTGEQAGDAAARLGILEQTRDGFLIAEEDLRQRGAGDLLGTAQSGLPPLRIGDLGRDRAVMERARDMAIGIYRDDPSLALPENQRYVRAMREQGMPASPPTG